MLKLAGRQCESRFRSLTSSLPTTQLSTGHQRTEDVFRSKVPLLSIRMRSRRPRIGAQSAKSSQSSSFDEVVPDWTGRPTGVGQDR
jgi:hypothetical protein